MRTLIQKGILYLKPFLIVRTKDSWYKKKINSYLVFNELALKVKNSLHTQHKLLALDCICHPKSDSKVYAYMCLVSSLAPPCRGVPKCFGSLRSPVRTPLSM